MYSCDLLSQISLRLLVCASYRKKRKKGRIVHFLRLPPQKGEIGRAQEKEASTEHYRSCYQLRMLKNIDVSILASDVGKLDFAGAGHLLRCCAQSRVF